MSLRVLHCPWIVGGHAAGLSAAERQLGVESRTLAFRASSFGYAVDEILWGADEPAVFRQLKRFSVLPRILREFDVIHFNFGSTILPQRVRRAADGAGTATRLGNRAIYAYSALLEQLDLRLLARSGKAIFVTFQGDDARQGEVSSRFPVNAAVETAPGYYSAASDRDKRRRIARFERWTDGLYALNPDLLRVLPSRTRFVPYAHVSVAEWTPTRPIDTSSRPLVLHAPTDRLIKGTRFIVEAVSRLQGEGLDFDFQLVEGLTHAQAKALYARADLVVDQLLVGWYGGLAVEAMALERPVVSYIRDEDLEFVPTEMRAEIPVINAQPETIYDVLKELLTVRRGELAEIGERGRRFVSRWHDPLRIAKELIADYEKAVNRRGAGATRAARR